ncbi:hypothetical protein ITK70_001598, partial [Campylobacter lari]|nr:hypothetical protein [Campylobacter lari]
ELDNIWIFHDHATALRASNVSEIIILLQDELSDEQYLLLQNILTIDINKLILDDFYSKHTNHGLDQSLALYKSSFVWNNANSIVYRDISVKRINEELSFAFCKDGGHKENSPAYLSYGISQVLDALKIGHRFEHENSSIYFPLDILKKSFLVLGYFIQFNGIIPLIGDSISLKPKDFLNDKHELYYSKEYMNYLYCLNNLNGVKPTENFLFLKESGYAIIKDFDRKLHLVFKCKHISNYHRHDDDLNFTLFYDNEEWFVDGGLYEYAEKDEFRKYLRSHFSHNLSYPNCAKAHRNLNRSTKTHINNLSNDK